MQTDLGKVETKIEEKVIEKAAVEMKGVATTRAAKKRQAAVDVKVTPPLAAFAKKVRRE